MGTGTLTDRSNGQTIDETFFNEIHDALQGDFVPRNSSGVATDEAGSLGTSALHWQNLYANTIYLGSTEFVLNTSEFVTQNFKVESGRKATGHNGERYILPHGTNAEATIKAGGANPDLVLTIGGTTVTITSDKTVSSLTTAPSTNNTCLINNTSLGGSNRSKLYGEFSIYDQNDDFEVRKISIDNVGTEISSLADSWQFFELDNGVSTEIFLGYINSGSNEIQNCLRGFGYNSSETEESRITCNNNDTITLLQGNHIFLDQNGTTTYQSNFMPIYSGVQPSSPSTNQYWFDIPNDQWKRYNGSSWDSVERIYLGVAICDSSGCTHAWSAPFFFKPVDTREFPSLFQISSTQIRTANAGATWNVYGNEFAHKSNFLEWDIASDLESGLTEAASTNYFLYVTDQGEPILSETHPRPYDWRKGYYHPHKPWLWVGCAYNDSSSDLISAGGLHQVSRIRLYGHNGTGATNTARHRFTTVGAWQGGAIVYIDSASLGAKFNFEMPGLVTVNLRWETDSASGGDTDVGIVNDGASTTVSISTTINSSLVKQYARTRWPSGLQVKEALNWSGHVAKHEALAILGTTTPVSGSVWIEIVHHGLPRWELD